MKNLRFLVPFALMAFAMAAWALPPGLNNGGLALGRFKGGQFWFPARITAIAGEAVSLQYLDGDRETVQAPMVKAFQWRAGGRVECNWKRQGKFYAAEILGVAGQKISVRYIEDGVQEQTTLELCREKVAADAPGSPPHAAAAAKAGASNGGAATAPAGSIAGLRYGPAPAAGAANSDSRHRHRVIDTPADQLLKGPLGFDCTSAKEEGPFYPGDCVAMFDGRPAKRVRGANALLLGFVDGAAVLNEFRPRFGDVKTLHLDPKLIWDKRMLARMDALVAQREQFYERFFKVPYGREYIWQFYRHHPLYARLDGQTASSVTTLQASHAEKIVAHWDAIAKACDGDYRDYRDPFVSPRVRSIEDDYGLICHLASDLGELKALVLRYHASRVLDEWTSWARQTEVKVERIHDYDASLQPQACRALTGVRVHAEVITAMSLDDAGLRRVVYDNVWSEDVIAWGKALGIDPLSDNEVAATFDKAAGILKELVSKASAIAPAPGWCATAGKPTDVEGELRAKIAKDWPGATIEKMGYVSSRYVDTSTITGYLVRKSDLKVVKTIRERTSATKHGAVLLKTKGGQCVYAMVVATRYDQGKGLGKPEIEALIPHLVRCN